VNDIARRTPNDQSWRPNAEPETPNSDPNPVMSSISVIQLPDLLAAIHHPIVDNSIMFRSALRRSARVVREASVKSVKPRVTKRFASSHDAPKSSDLPWAIPSAVITVPIVLPVYSVLIIVFLVVVYYTQDGRRSSV
jgi:hypothetical protein